MPPRDIGLIALVILAWGSNFTAMKLALEEVPPFLMVGLRFAILVPLITVLKRPALPWSRILAVGALINMGQFAFLFAALNAEASAGLASLLIQMQAPLTIALSFLVFGERIRPLQIAGLALALAGLGVFAASSGGNVTGLGLALLLMAALSWACGNLVLKRVGRVDTLALFIWASLVPPLPMLALSVAVEGPAPFATIAAMSAQGWLAVIYVALASTVLGYSIWGALLARHPAALVTPFALLIPVVGVSIAALVLGESLTPRDAIGGAIILAGLALTQMGAKRSR
ncbi:EamA family transporter [Alterinioella nitratireducens]|uniref:EamA family transporter n=1 Tax=Alterinioella nitratireducens TaxID=2735915 RepID=UPI001553FD90|nr:EamA family transporter [Alterinioella nitratireducens]NPD19235.1 EamA family transporter [Alterinioella nitratireducens]